MEERGNPGGPQEVLGHTPPHTSDSDSDATLTETGIGEETELRRFWVVVLSHQVFDPQCPPPTPELVWKGHIDVPHPRLPDSHPGSEDIRGRGSRGGRVDFPEVQLPVPLPRYSPVHDALRTPVLVVVWEPYTHTPRERGSEGGGGEQKIGSSGRTDGDGATDRDGRRAQGRDGRDTSNKTSYYFRT